MMRILLPVALAASLAVAAPVLADPANWKPLDVRADQVSAKIANGLASGALTDLQARALRDQFKGLRDLEERYSKSGLTPAQQADLQQRYDTLDARIEVDSHPASIDVHRAPADQ